MRNFAEELKEVLDQKIGVYRYKTHFLVWKVKLVEELDKP